LRRRSLPLRSPRSWTSRTEASPRLSPVESAAQGCSPGAICTETRSGCTGKASRSSGARAVSNAPALGAMHPRLFPLFPAAGAMLSNANPILHRPEHWIRAWFQCFRPREHWVGDLEHCIRLPLHCFQLREYWIGAREHCTRLAFHCFRPLKHWIETALSSMQADSCWNESYARSGCSVKLVISGRTLKRT
jgi:hypothetical protein